MHATPALGLVCAALLILQPATAQTPDAEITQQPQDRSQSVTPPAQGDEPKPADKAYVLAGGDLLRIQVYQQADLSMELRLHEDGHLSYPLLGLVAMAGLTVRQAEAQLESGLQGAGLLRRPQVSITVLQVRGHVVSVLGQVQRPGRFPLETPGLRLSELLAQAGGATALASDQIIVLGQRHGEPFRMTVDVATLFDTAARTQDLVVQHGDVVFVDRAPVVYLHGEVQRPGPVRLEREMTVLQALAASGGPTLRGTLRGLQITRRLHDGQSRRWTPGLQDSLRPGDVLHVPESLF